jgi:hypothetical protein
MINSRVLRSLTWPWAILAATSTGSDDEAGGVGTGQVMSPRARQAASSRS